jgi:hypothetical protein
MMYSHICRNRKVLDDLHFGFAKQPFGEFRIKRSILTS